MKIVSFALFSLLISACATVAPYQGDPLEKTPQAIQAAKPCSPLPFDHNSNWNPGPTGGGFTTRVPPTGMQEVSCGDKYLPSIYCADKTKCKGARWATNTPNKMASGDVHWVIDILQGAVSYCAQQSTGFGVGGLSCVPEVCRASGSLPTRCTMKVQVKGLVEPGPTEVIFDAVEDGTVIGAIGTAETMN